MLTISKLSANRLNIDLSGILDSVAMVSALDSLNEKSDGITQGKILYTIAEFEMPTLGAMAVEFSRMPQLFRLIRKFDKCAVLCDTRWIRTAAEIEGAIIPSLEIKSFALTDVVTAEAWLNGRLDEESDDNDLENFPV